MTIAQLTRFPVMPPPQKAGLADYTAPGYRKTDKPQGISNVGGSPFGVPGGPIQTPIIPGVGNLDNELDVLKAILNSMNLNSFYDVYNLRKFTTVKPRENIPFWSTNAAPASLAAAASVAVATFPVPQGQSGFITGFMLSVGALGSFSDIQWSLKKGEKVMPGFSLISFDQFVYGRLLDFEQEIIHGEIVTLNAYNAGSGSQTVSGAFTGWTEIITPDKQWGGQSANGL